ncbi:MAG: hypothetical protein KBA31_01030 [Alphaproteobacteria bacterium]|nr:hypothetical protein [Alphaproteobacteria bacterium]
MEVMAASLSLTRVRFQPKGRASPTLHLTDGSELTASELELAGEGVETAIQLDDGANATLDRVIIGGYGVGIDVKDAGFVLKGASRITVGGVGIRIGTPQNASRARDVVVQSASIAGSGMSRSVGVQVSTGVSGKIEVRGSTIYGFDVGVESHSALSVNTGSQIVGNATGIQLSGSEMDSAAAFAIERSTLRNRTVDLAIMSPLNSLSLTESILSRVALASGRASIDRCETLSDNTTRALSDESRRLLRMACNKH